LFELADPAALRYGAELTPKIDRSVIKKKGLGHGLQRTKYQEDQPFWGGKSHRNSNTA